MDPIFGTSNNLFIEDAVAETQVLTSGISAEYGAFTGGVLNVITKSGGNDFHGSLRADFTRPEWRDETPFEDDRGIEREGDLCHETYAATLGGRDRPRPSVVLRRRPRRRVAEQPGGAPRHRHQRAPRPGQHPLRGQADRQHHRAAHACRLPTSTIRRSRRTRSRSRRSSSTPSAATRSARTSGYVVGYTGVLTDSLFAEAALLEEGFPLRRPRRHRDATSSTSPDPFGLRRIPGNTAGTFNAPYFDATDPEDRNNEQLYGALSYFLDPAKLGSHDFKLGAERFTVTRTGGNSQTSTGFVFYTGYQLAGTQPVLDANGRLIPVFTSAAAGRRGDDSRIGIWVPTSGAELDITTDSFFLNDRWVLNDNWSRSTLGVRYEKVALRGDRRHQQHRHRHRRAAPRPRRSIRRATASTSSTSPTPSTPAATTRRSSAPTPPVGNPALLYGYYVGPQRLGRQLRARLQPQQLRLLLRQRAAGERLRRRRAVLAGQHRVHALRRHGADQGRLRQADLHQPRASAASSTTSSPSTRVAPTSSSRASTPAASTTSSTSNTDAPQREYQAIMLQGAVPHHPELADRRQLHQPAQERRQLRG